MAGNVDVQRLEVILEAQTKQYERAMDRYANRTEAAARRAERAFENSRRKITRSSQQLSRDLRNAVAGVAIGLAAREVVQYADAWTEAGNKIAAAGTPLDQQTERLKELAATAIDTRSSFDATASLYARLGIATENLTGKSYDLLKVTELINKATVAGGASTAERNSTVLQLSQALASGQLMGEELRSLRENAPILLRAIAKEFDVPIGALKELGAEGKLTSERILDAILKAEGEISARFAKTDVTISDSLTNLRTRLTEYIGGTDDSVSASEKLAGAINFVAENVDAFVEGLVVVTASLVGAFGAQAVASAVAGLASITAGANTASKALAVLRASALTALGPLGIVVGTATAALAYFLIKMGQAADEAQRFAEVVNRADDALARTANYVDPFGETGESAETATPLVNALTNAVKDYTDALNDATLAKFIQDADQLQRSINETNAEIERLENKRAEMRRPGAANPNSRLGRAVEAARQEDLSEINQNLGVLKARRSGLMERQSSIAVNVIPDGFMEEFIRDPRGAIDRLKAQLPEPVESGSAATGTSDQIEKDRAAAVRALAEIEEAHRRLYSTEREQIEHAHQARLSSISELKASSAEKDAAIVQSAAIRDAELAEIDKQEAERKQQLKERAQQDRDREIDFMRQVMDSRDQMTGRLVSIMDREYALKREQIVRELTDREEQNEAILALEEERLAAEKQLRDRLLGQNAFSNDDLERFKTEMEERQAVLENALEQGLIAEEEYQQQLSDLREQYRALERERELASMSTILSASQGFMSAMISLAEQRFGKSSAITKGLFLLEKAAAAAQIIVSAELAKMRTIGQLGLPAALPFLPPIEVAKNISLATVAASTIAGFEKGGYTGNGGAKEVAGVVHGQEFVLNKAATNKYRSLAESMNNGTFEAQLARLSQPTTVTPAFMTTGGRTINVAGSNIVFNGPVDGDTASQFRSMLDQQRRELTRDFEKTIERDRMRTTPRHERGRFLKG